MITVNSIVKSKDTRVQDAGKVIALFQTEYFLLQVQYDPDEVWGKKYPDWKQKPVALVIFDKPQRTMTLDEWKEIGLKKGATPENAEKSYELHCPRITQTAFPIDDLEEIPQNTV